MAQGGFTFSHLPGGVFDARSVDPAPSFTVPPMDDYIVGATAVVAEENSKGTGGFLNFTLEIQQAKSGSQQFTKITVPYRLNIFHNDPQTREIAYKQLSALAHVVGRLQLQKPEDLLCNPQTGQGYFIATIGPQKNNEQYSNVFGVKDLAGNSPGKSGANSAIAATPAPSAPMPVAPAAAPWQQPQASPALAPNPPAAHQPWAPPAYQTPAAPVQAQPPAWTPAQEPVQQVQQPAAAPLPPWQQNAAPANAAPAPSVPPWQR